MGPIVYLAIIAAGVGLYWTVWDQGVRSNPWPHSAGAWTLWSAAFLTASSLLALPWRGRLLLGLTAGAWALLVMTMVVLGGAGQAFGMVAWLLCLSYGLGEPILRFVMPTVACSVVERVAFRLLLGFGPLALAVAGLGFLGALWQPVLVGTLLLLTLPFAAQLPGLVREVRSHSSPALAGLARADLRLPALGLAWMSLCFAQALPWAVAPNVDWDPLWYHLPIAAADAAAHSFVSLPSYTSSHFIGSAHALYALSFVLVGQPLPSLVHFCFGPIGTALVFALAQRVAGPIAGWAAAVLFASTPMVSWLAGSPYVDLFLIAYTFGSLYSVQRWWTDRQVEWLLLAGLLGAMALTVKLSAAFFLALGGVLALPSLPALWRYAVRAPARTSLLAGLGVLVLLPWVVRNSSASIDPTFAQCEAILASMGLPSGASVAAPAFGTGPLEFQRERLLGQTVMWQYFGLERELRGLLLLPYQMVVGGERLSEFGYGVLGIGPLLWLASLLVGRRIPPRAWLPMFILVALALALWFHFSGYTRYILPIVPVIVLLAVLTLPHLFVAAETRRSRVALTVVFCTVGIAYVAATRGAAALISSEFFEGYPYQLALGLESREEYLRRVSAEYPAYEFMSQESRRGGRVLAAGTQRRFYYDGELDDWTSPAAACLGRLPPGPALVRALDSLGYEFILVNWRGVNFNRRLAVSRLPFVQGDFLRDFTRKEFSQMHPSARSLVEVYRLPALER